MNYRGETLGSYDPRGYRRWLFRDRADAGAQLAAKLLHFKGDMPLVLGIPHGGVPVALEVAHQLDGELDVKVACRLAAPDQPELAVGAVSDDGTMYLDGEITVQLGLSDRWIDQTCREQTAEAKRHEQRFRRGQAPLAPGGRVVILVDDGLATGATMRAAAQTLKGKSKRLVAAVPIATTASLGVIADEVDEVLCLHRPDPFFAVSLHYRSFEAVSDEEVERILADHRKQRRPTAPPPGTLAR